MGWKSISSVFVAVALFTAACGQTDAGITTAVKGKLAADTDVSAYKIDVDTENKVVTLTGSVESEAAKAEAVRLARETDGVTRVIDNITIMAPTASAPAEVPDAARAVFADPTVTSAVKTKLLADPMVGGMRIDVDTAQGVVTLSGEVKTAAERDQAIRLARETDGVKSVNDKLTVRP